MKIAQQKGDRTSVRFLFTGCSVIVFGRLQFLVTAETLAVFQLLVVSGRS